MHHGSAKLQPSGSKARRTAVVSLKSANTTSAPAARSALTSYPPVATATDRAPDAAAHATSSGVSPTTAASDGDAAGPPHARTAASAFGSNPLRTGAASPNAPQRKYRHRSKY